MTDEQQAAYVNANAVAALIEAMGMTATNASWINAGQDPVYLQPHFEALIEKYGIHHNSMMSLFHGV